MNIRKRKLVVISTLLCALCFVTQLQVSSSNIKAMDKLETNVKLLTPGSPIFINGDADFITQASTNNWDSGGTLDGSSANPFVIKDYSFDFSVPAINILDTTLYFKIENCQFVNSFDAITLNKVSHGSIINCTIYSCLVGITINNTSSDNLVEDIVIKNAITGLFLYNCEDIDVFSCEIQATTGISVNYGTYNLFYGNNLSNNEIAMDFQNSNGNTIEYNDIPHNSEVGINFVNTNSSSIFGNNINANTEYGIQIQSGFSNHIKANNFIDNYLVGTSQAFDSGELNTFECNYWNDWESPDDDNDGYVDTPYSISGIADNEDSRPLTNEIQDPRNVCSISMPAIIAIPSLFMVSLCTLVLKRRKKSKVN